MMQLVWNNEKKNILRWQQLSKLSRSQKSPWQIFRHHTIFGERLWFWHNSWISFTTRFVFVHQDQRIQTKLLDKSTLTLDSVQVGKQHGREASTQKTKQRRQVEKNNVLQPRDHECWRCGEAHNPTTCYFKTQEFFSCKKEGQRTSCCPRKTDKKPNRSLLSLKPNQTKKAQKSISTILKKKKPIN